MSEQGAWLQLGRILLRVVLAPPTIPVHEPMELPAGGPSLAVDTLLVVASGKLPRLWLGGQRSLFHRPAACWRACAARHRARS
ncbi:MAG: hypothetical protein U1F43_07545 [Myxococcota bacterium]